MFKRSSRYLEVELKALITFYFAFLSKTSQTIFDLHPGFFHMEDEKGNKLHLFKKYFKMMFLLYKSSLILIVIHFNHFLCDESFCKEK